jgi:dipeptidyl aminopeptidase/acylaminoacyl peptidase
MSKHWGSVLNSYATLTILAVGLVLGICKIHAAESGKELVASAKPGKRPVRIADSIGMTQTVDRYMPAIYSPDGSKFVVLTMTGNLKQNTVDYSVLLWTTAEVFHSEAPETVLMMSSSSNQPAIEDLTWMSDNKTVAFLGENPGELGQVYILNTETRTLKKLTNHTTDIRSYSVAENGDRVAYIPERIPESIWDEQARRRGIVVSTQLLPQLLQGKTDQWGGWTGEGLPLFVSSPGESGRVLKTRDRIETASNAHLCFSPDGRYIVVATKVARIPEDWKEYTDPSIRSIVSGGSPQRFEIVNTVTGESRFLLDSPPGSGSEVLWLPDSRSLVVSQVFLPLGTTEGAEREARRSKTFTVEVNISDGRIAKITDQLLALLSWDAKGNSLAAHSLRLESNTQYGIGEPVFFRKHGNGTSWERLEVSEEMEPRPEVVVEQDMNTPPKIVAKDPKTHRKAMLLDLNPQFSELNFAKVEEIQWKNKAGEEDKGGLYYPINYVPGRRYPFVLLTHGWTPYQFWIDGADTTGYAAQSLAGHDIFVLQADDSSTAQSEFSSEGASREIGIYEAAIDYLDQKGLIDRARVGILGFSRTCFFVKYALTHSRYHFAAAAINDGADLGYFSYVEYASSRPSVADMFERTYGGHPWGEELKAWLKHTPAFKVDKVQAPVRIMALNDRSLFGEWEFFSLLKRIGKPVEMIYLQDGAHELVKPWDRVVAQGGNEEWFRFWLKGEEDTDPAKADQYVRWRELRKLQQSSEAGDKPN